MEGGPPGSHGGTGSTSSVSGVLGGKPASVSEAEPPAPATNTESSSVPVATLAAVPGYKTSMHGHDFFAFAKKARLSGKYEGPPKALHVSFADESSPTGASSATGTADRTKKNPFTLFTEANYKDIDCCK